MKGSNTQGNGRVLAADEHGIAVAAELLRAGRIVAVPTETVYGLAGDAGNPVAVAGIYAAKGRPDFNPLIVHVPNRTKAAAIARFDSLADRLAQTFWPGPLTLVLPLAEDAPITAAVTAGLGTIALRCPAHPAMRALLEKSELFLAAPSANRSGGISPTRAGHVTASLGDNVPLVLDGGACDAGLESTIVAVRDTGWQILRPGPVTLEAIEAVAGSAPLPLHDVKIEAPGQLVSHYAPAKPVRLSVTVPHADEWHIGFGATEGDDNLSPDGDLAEAAARLFDALHRADASTKQRIAIAAVPETGIGIAINDRLRRAAA